VMELTTLSFNILGGTDSRLEKTSKQMTRWQPLLCNGVVNTPL
jgi:hypothetical protein